MANFIENYKSLPAPTKGILTAGTLLGLFVALPLFLFAVLNVNFDIRNKAASGEPITGEPIPVPTPTDVPFPSPTPSPIVITPTPVACQRALPSVSMAPSNQSGNPGDSLEYTISIVNNDSSNCPTTTYTFTPLTPFNWTAIAPPPVVSSPGSHGQTIIRFTSTANTPQGTLPVGVTVNTTLGSVSASASYTIGLPTPTPTPTPPAYGGMLKNGSFETNLDADRIPDLWTWGKTIAPSSTEGINCDSNRLDGNCSVRMNGGLFQKVLSQKINYLGRGKQVFSFDVWSKSDGAVGPGKYRIEINFLNAKGKLVVRKIYNFDGRTHDFQKVRKSADTFKINKEYSSIVINLIYTKPFGKVWFDNVSLNLLSPNIYDSLPKEVELVPETPLQLLGDLF